MKRNMDEILKHALSPEDEPDRRLNQKILYRAEEMTHMAKKRHGRIPAAILAASFTLIIGSTAVFAAWKYLNPAQVAERLEDGRLTDAFQSEDAVALNETQEYGGYKVTLLGAAAGKNMNEYLDDQENVQDDRFYVTVAIERTDGTPMPDTGEDAYGEEPFFVSPYIRGLDPVWYNAMTLGGGYGEFVQNGIQYRMLEVDNIEMFADRGIYIGVSSGSFPDNNAYCFDESTGEITRNDSYEGVNALFSLPLDPAKADPEAAKAFLEEMENPQDDEEEPLEKTAEDMEVDAWIAQVNAGNLDDYAEVIESTVQVCKPNADGEFYYSWELESGAGGSGTGYMDVSFPDRKAGTRVINSYSYSDDGLESLYIETHTLNEDGTVTVAIYRPKKN